MKVAILTTSFPRWPGDFFGNYILYVAAEHAKNGAQVRVIAPHVAGARSREWLDGVEVRRFRYALPASMQTLAYGGGILTELRRSPLAWLQLPAFFLSFLLRSLPVVLRADVVHAHWTLAGVIGIALARLFRKRAILTLYGIEVFTGRFWVLTRLCLRWADHVICISTATERKMRELVGEDIAVTSSVIPYGITDEFLAVEPTTLDLRARHQVAEGSPVVLSVGRLIERKGLKHLLRAVPLVIREAPAHFVIAGEGPERARLEQLAEELEIRRAVSFTGQVPSDELPSYYAQCDIFVHPIVTDRSGDVEGLGIVLLEAMAKGKPTVASAAGGVPDVTADGETGFLVPEADPRKLADRILQLASDASLRERMGRAGRQRVQELFSVPTLANSTMCVYLDG